MLARSPTSTSTVSGEHPFTSSILDIETDPVKAEQQMAVALERVKARDHPARPKVDGRDLQGARAEFIGSPRTATIAALELTLRSFRGSRCPRCDKVAELYDRLAAGTGARPRAEYAGKALEHTSARRVRGNHAWTDANRDDRGFNSRAAGQGRPGCAADHTNAARANVDRAAGLSDEANSAG
jgi:hypothetical protein